MSLALLEDHRRTWKAKPVLADVYGVWLDAVAGVLAPLLGLRVHAVWERNTAK